jgi:hypothetical protein
MLETLNVNTTSEQHFPTMAVIGEQHFPTMAIVRK